MDVLQLDYPKFKILNFLSFLMYQIVNPASGHEVLKERVNGKGTKKGGKKKGI